MYKISVPTSIAANARAGLEKVYENLTDLDASRVFIYPMDLYTDDAEWKDTVDEIKKQCAFFREKGLETGVWIPAFFPTFLLVKELPFQKMRSISGKITDFICPSDSDFVKYVCARCTDIAKCGPDIIMFDDDFRYGFLPSGVGDFGCLCDRHISMINEITKEEKTREELCEYIKSGGRNRFRDAFLEVNGKLLEAFALSVRRAVDKVCPSIRIGACTCMSSWDIDGTDPEKIARIFAGDNKPFMRLIGAPYWAVNKSWGSSLQDVIEYERMESAWTEDKGIEIFSEGDVYPRPRTNCPASYLEGFDTALRAAGCTDGILKYALDYVSDPDYETGYIEYHKRNRSLYTEIEKAFAGKKPCGIRVYEYKKRLPDIVSPDVTRDSINVDTLFFSNAARTLAHNTIPSVYEGEGVCGIVFDENARHIPKEALKGGMIIDIYAARILSSRGIDVGIESFDGGYFTGRTERYLSNGNSISMIGTLGCRITLKENAEVLSVCEIDGETHPVSFRYENAEGCRFLVLNIKTDHYERNILFHYARSRQIAETLPWLSGNTLPAYCYGHPHLYMQCAEDASSLSVGLWNYHADIVFSPEILLGKEYTEIRFINCSGKLEKNKVTITDIPAFGFAGFEVK